MQAEKGARLQTVINDTAAWGQRLAALESKVRDIQTTGSTASTNDSGRVPALIMGGWPPDTLASEVLDKANAMARDLKLPILYLGIGESVDDMVDFRPREFAEALFA